MSLTCNPLNQDIEIRKPSELIQIIKIVQDKLLHKILKAEDFWPEGQIRFEMVYFETIDTHGPWPSDVLQYYFVCSCCGKHYELNCETYHGSGGHWRERVEA